MNQELKRLVRELADTDPRRVLAVRCPASVEARITALIRKHRDAGLTAIEVREWRMYERIEHRVRMAKARALARLRAAGGSA